MSNHPEVTFFVNDEVLVVHTHALTVKEILDAAGISVNDHILTAHEHGQEVIYVEPERVVPLCPGLRLRSRHHVRVYQIVVNGRNFDVTGNVVTYEQVVALAPNLPPTGEGVEYNVTFGGAVKPKEGDLIHGETVNIKNGTHFVVSSSNRS